MDDTLVDETECDDERTARVMTDIANNVMPGIIMEFDVPSRNSDRKMPILDMKVWMEEGDIIFQHYEKPSASKSIMHATSAQSVSCRYSVHTQEILRRILNSSPLLNWKTCVAPVLSSYMSRMMLIGYPVKYINGTRHLYRPKTWNVVARRIEKEKKQHDWSTRGGYVAPIFVPPTPNNELAKSLKIIAENESEAGVKFKIIETGGLSMRSVLQRSNPLETQGCDSPDCLPCAPGRGEGGNCEGSSANYEIECQLCPEGSKSIYIGESSRNLYTRSKEHLASYRSGEVTSFIGKHQNTSHPGEEPMYVAKVTSRTRDCLTRQVREAILIRRSQVPILNSKTEWHQPALYRVQNEVERG